MTDSAASAPRICIVGGGKMGEAILSGLIDADEGCAATWTASQFTVVNPGVEKRDRLTSSYGVRCVADVSEVEAADIVVLAVKPQVMMGVLQTISESPFATTALFISVAAGLPTSSLSAALGGCTRMVRVMPNTPLTIGEGATTVCVGAGTDDSDRDLVLDLFSCMGDAYLVDEASMDVTGAISGSGPAYVAYLIEALADAAEARGLDRELALDLAAQTVYGTGALIVRAGQSAQLTREQVCSPNGTTLAALAALDDAGFPAAIDAAIDAAVARSKELAR